MARGPDIRRPFTRADAVAAGLNPRLLEGSGFRRIFRGVYIAAGVPDTPEVRAAAALAPFGPDAFASHATAARVHAVPIPTLPDEHVTVFAARDRRDRNGVRAHVAQPAQAGEVLHVGGTRISGYARMFVELAELLTLVDLVVVGDNLARRRLVRPDDLVAYAAASRLRGATLARRAATYVRERVDSPMETRLRMLMVLAGLPEPEVNPTVRDEYGDPLRRYDLLYRRSRTIVEYDGRQHIERERNWESDLERREGIDRDGHRIIVVVAKGIYVEPEHTLRRIWTVLKERREPGLPSRLSDAWRPHFPARAAA